MKRALLLAAASPFALLAFALWALMRLVELMDRAEAGSL
jgi:hypothetical protein